MLGLTQLESTLVRGVTRSAKGLNRWRNMAKTRRSATERYRELVEEGLARESDIATRVDGRWSALKGGALHRLFAKPRLVGWDVMLDQPSKRLGPPWARSHSDIDGALITTPGGKPCRLR